MKTALIAVALVVVISAATVGIARTGAAPVVAETVASRTPPNTAPNRLTCEQVPAFCAPALGVSLLTLAAPATLAIGAALALQRRPLFERASAPRTSFARVPTPPPRAA